MNGRLRTTAMLVGASGAMAGAALGMLTEQGRRARRVLTRPGWYPFRADGVYLPDGSGPRPPSEAPSDTLTLAVLGDSTAAGLGVDRPGELPGVVLARGLAEESDRPVRLDTYAICGCTSRRLGLQVDTTLLAPADAVLIMIGANDVTLRVPPKESARLLGEAVAALRAAGTQVVVGTCPDLGAVRHIPQPLRAIARTWSLVLARLQHDAVLRAGGQPVPLADLLSSEFSTRPALFSLDHYHPSSAGYDAACSVLLPALCSVLGVWAPGMAPGRAEAAPVRPGAGQFAPAVPDVSAPAASWGGWAASAFDRGLRRVWEQSLGARS
ncbi:MAG TPA: SGNH/GDSL hydrolase family protein [Pseudonocardiaceae bacterium]